MKKKNNILFILCDGLKDNCLGYNNSEVYTPNLDLFKSQSVSFINGYTTNPSTILSTASIYNGNYSSQFKSLDNTFVAQLQSNGYYTVLIGKKGLSDDNVDIGYDEEIIINNDLSKLFDDTRTKFLVNNRFKSKDNLVSKSEDLSYTYLDDGKYSQNSLIGDIGLTWLNDNSITGEKPWFLTLSYSITDQLKNRNILHSENIYDDAILTLPNSSFENSKDKGKLYSPDILSKNSNITFNACEEEIQASLKSYYSQISLIDKKLGIIFDKLKELGEWDNSVIFFSSNHGYYMGDFKMIGHTNYLSQAMMRVPLLLKPAIKGYVGREEESVGYNFDIVATALEIANIDIPNDISSKSLLPFIEDLGTQNLKDCEKTPIYFESNDMRSIIRDGWKLVYYKNKSFGELYDLTDDPYEEDNVYFKDSFESIKWGLTKLLCDKMIELGSNN